MLYVKNSPSAHHCTTLSGYIFATKAHIDNQKKMVKQQYLPICSHNMVNFGPLAADIGSLVWGTAYNDQMIAYYAHPRVKGQELSVCNHCRKGLTEMRSGRHLPCLLAVLSSTMAIAEATDGRVSSSACRPILRESASSAASPRVGHGGCVPCHAASDDLLRFGETQFEDNRICSFLRNRIRFARYWFTAK